MRLDFDPIRGIGFCMHGERSKEKGKEKRFPLYPALLTDIPVVLLNSTP